MLQYKLFIKSVNSRSIDQTATRHAYIILDANERGLLEFGIHIRRSLEEQGLVHILDYRKPPEVVILQCMNLSD